MIFVASTIDAMRWKKRVGNIPLLTELGNIFRDAFLQILRS